MLWLSGHSGREVRAVARDVGIGLLTTPRNRQSLAVVQAHPFWAADNGCMAQGAAFQLAPFLAMLDRLAPARDTCLFAVAPDVVCDGAATLARSAPVLPMIRQRGYRAALVWQRGMTSALVPWEEIDVLFIGDHEPCRGVPVVRELITEARQRGKSVHVGRVNSWRTASRWAAEGANSADGTTLAFGPRDKLPVTARWVQRVARQPPLPIFAGTSAARDGR